MRARATVEHARARAHSHTTHTTHHTMVEREVMECVVHQSTFVWVSTNEVV
eukprot:COSAG02_NODE_2260_length_9317_cov_10.918365_10_plen_51_part_00